MDTLRGNFESSDVSDDSRDYDVTDEESGRDVPPPSIGQDERRMQVRAYNFWAGMLDDRNYPSIEELDPESNDDFGPFGVLLDFSVGIEDPAVQYLGKELAKECGTEGDIRKLSDVPPRSLLSRITDHYMQILANQAPIGFEAEFVNQRGNTVLYRGILLPFSSDDETIDFIYGVINWKEMADAASADELLLEIDQALASDDTASDTPAEENAVEEDLPAALPVADWADGPGADDDQVEPAESLFDSPTEDEPASVVDAAETLDVDSDDDSNVEPLDLADLEFDEDAHIDPSSGLPTPAFGDYDLGDEEDEEEDEANYDFASLTDHIKAPAKKALSLDFDITEPEGEDAVPAEEAPAVPSAYEPEEPVFDPALVAPESPDVPEVEFEEEVASFEASEIESSADPVEPFDLEEPLDPMEPVEEDEQAQPFELAEEFAEPVDSPAEDIVGEEDSETPVPAIEPIEAAVELEPQAEVEAPAAAEDDTLELVEELGDDAGLHDCLASARELAQAARTSEERSRSALYAAVGRAYDFAIVAQASPEDYSELLAENGLTMQDRAPMTPIVKLVFGVDYDKTRLTEYAAVLTHAHRVGIERGALADFLAEADGGLKGVVQAERRVRRELQGKSVDSSDEVRSALAKKLRRLEVSSLNAIEASGAEFSVVMVRRTEAGEVVVIGEIDEDIALIEKVGRKLLA